MPPMTEDALALLQVIGLRPVFVEELGRDALILGEYGLLLLDRGLTPADLADLADQALSDAAASLCGR